VMSRMNSEGWETNISLRSKVSMFTQFQNEMDVLSGDIYYEAKVSFKLYRDSNSNIFLK